MANFDDLDPISQEPDIDLVMLTAGNAIPGDADLIIIPGTKSTIGDLKFLREQKWDLDLAAISTAVDMYLESAVVTKYWEIQFLILREFRGPQERLRG